LASRGVLGLISTIFPWSVCVSLSTVSALASLSNVMKPKPRLRLVSRSIMTMASITLPKRPK
jgi:hypothetical protein